MKTIKGRPVGKRLRTLADLEAAVDRNESIWAWNEKTGWSRKLASEVLGWNGYAIAASLDTGTYGV